MASTSIQNSPSSPWIWKYDVFLSFRGDDTRYNFIDHLFAALHRRAIITFKDDIKLKKGKAISKELLKAIEESQICIVVFSKDYAASTWCLEELAKIVDCNEQVDRDQTVLPVFYDVDPSEVRKQSGSYREAFARHEETFTNSEKVQRWRKALSKVGNLSGWDARNKPESQIIEDIVKVTTSVLGHKLSNLADDLVGIQSRLEILNKHLALGLNDVRYIGIVGMGGIGKTTLATVLYDRNCHYFDASSFLENVNKGYEDDGLINLQKQLLCETLQEENMKIWSLHTGTSLISTKLRSIKCLIVLDNVEQSYQLEKLAGKLEWFGAGSRIIITTRDEHILKEYGVDHVYKVELLNEEEEVELFCRKAFKCDYPLEKYKGLTHRVLKYVKSLPLAIKVFGSFLYKRSVTEWESALASLQENPKKEIIDVLRTSFDGLEGFQKDIFLDIACFFQGWQEQNVSPLLEFFGFHPRIGMKILIEKSLITIVDGRVWVHDLLQELGRKIIMEKSPKELGKWSRLWCQEHLQHIMTRNTGTEDVEVISLSGPCPKEIKFKVEILSKMSHLRMLRLDGMEISGDLSGLSNEIRCLSWSHCPYTYLPHLFSHWPSLFQLDRLVELFMPGSNFKQWWEGTKSLNNLRALDISNSKNLIKTPNFRMLPNLVWLLLHGCTSLTHVDESIGVLSKLEILELDNCSSLASLPSDIFRLTSLHCLRLSFCSKLNNPFEKIGVGEHVKKIIEKSTFTSSIVLKTMTSPFQFFTKRPKEPSKLLLHGLQSLQNLSLGFCNLRELPDAIGSMQSLELLDLKGNKFVTLPSTINKISRLAYLNLGECKELLYLPELPLSTNTDFLPGKLVPHYHSCPSFLFGVLIYNCPKLVENEIQPYTKLAFSWLTKLVQEPHHPNASYDTVIPGSDVPKWFNHQSLGHSTKMQLPRSSEWIGVAICVALVPNGHRIHYDAKVHYDIDFAVKLCGTQKIIHIEMSSEVKRSLVTFESDHLWLFYLPRDKPICRILQTWEAGKEVEFRSTGKHIKMTKCGVRWVSEQDIRQLELELLKESVPRQQPFSQRKRKRQSTSSGSEENFGGSMP